MLTKKVVSLRISGRLREGLQRRIAASNLSDPLPSVLLGKEVSNTFESLVIGLFERDGIPKDDPIRLIEVDGIEFLVTQDWLCDEFEGKLLDEVDGKIRLIG
jgi:hypothetical protein